MTVGEIILIVKEFIRDNWELLVFIGWLVMLIINLIRKKVKVNVNTTEVDSNKTLILELLPQFIKVAEDTIVGGESKKLAVITAIVKRIAELSDMSLQEVEDKYRDFISYSVEAILSTPEKKGN